MTNKGTSVQEDLLVWDGIISCNLNNNNAESWMVNQSNTYDREIAESMHFDVG